MILEGIVTTLDAAGTLNIAPMGPRIEPELARFVLRPFRTSTTYKNLKQRGEGVFHVTDDVLLLARATIGTVSDAPSRPAVHVRGRVLLESCRYYEFRVTEVEDREERATLRAETVHHGVFREFVGFNRARHAVLETAILASRIEFLPADGLAGALQTHRTVVQTPGDAPEAKAFTLLVNHMQKVAERRGFVLGMSESMTRLRIQTPSRLHFGWLGWGTSGRRQFGGVGLMIEQPGLEIVAENASDWSASGPLAERTLAIAVVVARRLDEERLPVRPVRFTNMRVPEAHIGLGVGTQLSLAVARAIAMLAGQPELDVASLARLTGRGRRSGIGIHGFAEGGLIVDAGRRSEKVLPTKLVRLPFPAEWSTLIVLPEHRRGSMATRN